MAAESKAEKMIADNAESLSDEDKQSLQVAIEEAKKDLESQDAARIDSARQRLEAELHKMAEAMYKDGGPAAADPAGAEAPPADEGEDVIDAEYTEEKGDS